MIPLPAHEAVRRPLARASTTRYDRSGSYSCLTAEFSATTQGCPPSFQTLTGTPEPSERHLLG
eukprot:scaffold966_cov415-Prasinococcus_capsulatus_cf.AAC.24